MFTGIFLVVLGLAIIKVTFIFGQKAIYAAASDTSAERNTTRKIRANVYPALIVALLAGMLCMGAGVAKLISLAAMNS